MISKAIVVGSYQRKLEELARVPGVDLVAIAPPSWRDSRGEALLERAYTDGYSLIETSIALNGHFHTHFYPQLQQELDRARPDLIHVDEEPYNLASLQAFHWARSRGCPAIFFTWQNINRSYPPPFNWVERFCYGNAAYAIAGNAEAAAVLRSKGYRGPVAIIPQFGVDPQLFHPQPESMSRPSNGRLVIGYAGGLVAEKGVDMLLRALALANGRLAADGAVQWSLAVAGTGIERRALETLSAALGLLDGVDFLGKIGSTDMPAFYAAIDCLVLPSRTTPSWKEQFGRVLVEAMASGVPVLGSSSGEIPQVIGDAGWVFPEDDVEALALQLIALAQQPALRSYFAQRGLARALDSFTQERIAQQTVAVYDAVLA